MDSAISLFRVKEKKIHGILCQKCTHGEYKFFLIYR